MTRPLALTAINHPYAGLGNRMRFTLSALEIARTTGRDFSFYWPTNDNFQPALTDLWHFPHREIPKDTIPPKFTEKDDLTKLDEVPNWAIRSDARLTYNGRERHWGAALRELQPHGDVKARTDAVLHELPRSFVAVQVRLGPRAPQKCLKHSPIEWYISRMRQIRESRPNTHFFISSDSTDALEQLLAEFPDSAHLPKRGGHNTLEGVREAMIDSYVMSRSAHILAAHWSSFPAMAWLLGNKRLAIETSLDLRLRESRVLRNPPSWLRVPAGLTVPKGK